MKRAVLPAACVGYALFCMWTQPGIVTAPDSVEYLQFWPIRTLGYPLFLELLGPWAAIKVQPLLYALVLFWLGQQTLRASGNLALAVAAVVAAMAVPTLREYHASILSESLFVSGVTALQAAAIGFFTRPTARTAALASIVAGLTVTIRNTAIAFLPVLLVMVMLRWRRLPPARAVVFAAALLPMVMIAGAERLAAVAVHGSRLTSLAGGHLFAKAAMLGGRTGNYTDPVRSDLEDLLDRAAPVRSLLSEAPTAVRDVLSIYYETCLQGPCVGQGRSALTDVERNIALQQIGLERIRQSPGAFLHLTWINYRSMWVAYRQEYPVTVAALNRFIAAHRPLPVEQEAFRPAPQQPIVFLASNRARYLQLPIVLLGLVTGAIAIAGLGLALLRRDADSLMASAAVAALCAHGVLLLSALTAAGLSRFMIGVWPAVTMAAILGGASLLGAGRTGGRRLQPPPQGEG
ncbi:MAG: hypothetical protein ABI665_06020 [Vicinamibacterales bacterium]